MRCAPSEHSDQPGSDQSSLSACRKVRSLVTHKAHSEDSDQTGRMLKLICIFAGRTYHFVGFAMFRLNYASIWCYCISMKVQCLTVDSLYL